jgi:hypothetical protein
MISDYSFAVEMMYFVCYYAWCCWTVARTKTFAKLVFVAARHFVGRFGRSLVRQT